MVQDWVTPTFHMLPKIHKNIEAPPGRPIVLGIGSLCENASTFVDYFLQPMVTQLPSFLQDSTHVICEFEQLQVTNKILPVTCDVESLYTNISHEDGIAGKKNQKTFLTEKGKP